MIRLVTWLVEWGVRHGPRYAYLRAIRDEIRALRTMCSEAIDTGGAITGDAERQWVRQVAYRLRAIEGHIGALMGGRHAPK